jgi:hypothetical protein
MIVSLSVDCWVAQEGLTQPTFTSLFVMGSPEPEQAAGRIPEQFLAVGGIGE